MTVSSHPGRLAVLAALLSVLVSLGFVLVGGSSYKVSARFANAGQLVKGGVVQVAGREVGSISEIRLTPDGVAEVELSIDDGDVAPLHAGTRMRIRAVSQAGVANRFVDVTPGPTSASELADGAVLGLEQTTGIVDVDALFESFGPDERKSLRQLIAHSSEVYAGSGSRYFNRMLGRLSPALAELNGLTGELARDRSSIRRLVDRAGEAATAVGSRRKHLEGAVANSASAFRAIAGERRSLGDIFERAPGALEQARGTLARTDTAVTALRPALRDVPPVAPVLGEFLHRTSSMLPRARPVVANLRGQLPALNRSLAGLRPLERPAVNAIRSSERALRDSRHIVRAMRYYGSDLILGIFNGLAGVATGNYSEKGHYARLEFTQNLETALGGGIAPLIEQTQPLPGIIDVRTKLLRRCPGGNVPPAIDGSSPWVPDRSLCTPEHNTPARVNEP